MTKRKHCRAPLFSSVLIEANKEVKKVRGVNISQGGVLLDSLPSDVPEIFKVIFPLARFPDFSKLDRKIISMMTRHSLDYDIIRATVQFSREDSSKENRGEGFCQAYKFIKFDDNFEHTIMNYTAQMVSNLAYYLNLFEAYDRGQKNNSDEDYIRVLAKMLGHTEKDKDKDKAVSLTSLRGRGLHDFQNLDQ